MTAARRALVALLTVTVVLAACGDDDDPDVSSGTTTTSTTTTEATATTTDGTTTTGGTAGDLPGERIEIFPYEGAELAVVGVRHDDTLNVRAGPGTGFDVVTELRPTAVGITATGHVRDLGSSFWTEVEVDATTGWVNVRFVSQLGSTEDITAQLRSAGPLPTGTSVLDVGMAVAQRAAGDAERPSIVVVIAPSAGDLGEVTIDVLGLPDDAQGGVRLHVFVASEDGGDTYAVKSVEATSLCTRGVGDGGACV
jgi:hypothetical protein